MMKRVGVTAGNLDADFPVSVSFKDYSAGQDPILDQIFSQELD